MCEWFGKIENRTFHLDNVAMLWHEFRHALVAADAGTTYCVIGDLHECDEESVQNITKLLAKPFPAENCLGNHVGIKALITSCSAPSTREFKALDLGTLTWTVLGSVFRVKKPSSPENLLCSIDSDVRDQCFCGLKILAAIQTPPTTRELFHLLNLDECQQAFEEMIEHCQDLVEVIDDRVYFLSSTGHEFFVNAKNISSIHRNLAQDCLRIIHKICSSTSIADLQQLDRPWVYDVESLQYAVLHWADHVELASDHAIDLLPEIMETFARDPKMTQKWWIAHLKLCHNMTQVDLYSEQGAMALRPMTVLHILARFNLHQMFREALNSSYWSAIEPYLRYTDCFDMDPLAVALSMHHTESAKFFLQQQVPISVMHVRFAADANPELSSMIFKDFLERCPSTLLENEDIEMIMYKTVTAGDEACVAQAIAFLKENNPMCFPQDWLEPLVRAFSCGHRNLVNMLLDITKLDKEENVVDMIAHAIDAHEEGILTDLLTLPRFKSLLATDKLINPLTLAIRLRCFRSVNVFLHAKNVNLVDRWGFTPLQCGALYGNAQAIYRVLLYGCKLNGRSREAGIALNLLIHEAGINAGMPILQELLDRGARIEYKDFGMTALHVAAECGRTQIMQMILESFSDAEIKEDIDRQPASIHGEWRDKTALAIAAMEGHDGIVRLLLERGADEGIKDREGKTALVLAREKGWDQVVRVFEDVQRQREERVKKTKRMKQERNKRKKK